MSTEPNTGADLGPTASQINAANKKIEEHPDCPCPDDTHVGPDHDILPDGGTFSVTGPEPSRAEKNVGLALEHAVERGKLRPYEAIEAANYFQVLLQPWVQRQHDHHVANTKRKA